MLLVFFELWPLNESNKILDPFTLPQMGFSCEKRKPSFHSLWEHCIGDDLEVHRIDSGKSISPESIAKSFGSLSAS